MRGQENNQFSIKASPFSLIGGRINTSIEKLTGSHITYGVRLEAFIIDNNVDKHLWLNPYGRIYAFNNESTGLFLELGGFYRYRYAKSAVWNIDQDYYKSALGIRLAPGFQFFVGKNKNIPIDILCGFNFDSGHKNLPQDNSLAATSSQAVNSLIGPLNIFFFRLQTGISF